MCYIFFVWKCIRECCTGTGKTNTCCIAIVVPQSCINDSHDTVTCLGNEVCNQITGLCETYTIKSPHTSCEVYQSIMTEASCNTYFFFMRLKSFWTFSIFFSYVLLHLHIKTLKYTHKNQLTTPLMQTTVLRESSN